MVFYPREPARRLQSHCARVLSSRGPEDLTLLRTERDLPEDRNMEKPWWSPCDDCASARSKPTGRLLIFGALGHSWSYCNVVPCQQGLVIIEPPHLYTSYTVYGLCTAAPAPLLSNRVNHQRISLPSGLTFHACWLVSLSSRWARWPTANIRAFRTKLIGHLMLILARASRILVYFLRPKRLSGG
jgi:hypothetical protein